MIQLAVDSAGNACGPRPNRRAAARLYLSSPFTRLPFEFLQPVPENIQNMIPLREKPDLKQK